MDHKTATISHVSEHLDLLFGSYYRWCFFGHIRRFTIHWLLPRVCVSVLLPLLLIGNSETSLKTLRDHQNPCYNKAGRLESLISRVSTLQLLEKAGVKVFALRQRLVKALDMRGQY